MTKRPRSKSPTKRKAKPATKSRIDPRQMGLFDALGVAPAVSAGKPRVSGSKAKLPRWEAVERPVVLSPREAAQYLGVSASTLKNWRAKKIGPRSVMRGARLVAYRPPISRNFSTTTAPSAERAEFQPTSRFQFSSRARIVAVG